MALIGRDGKKKPLKRPAARNRRSGYLKAYLETAVWYFASRLLGVENTLKRERRTGINAELP